jgi:putative flippase GtrA
MSGAGSKAARIAGDTRIRFLVAGVFNTVFGYSVYAGGIAAGLHYAWAMGIATVAGICFNYCTYGRMVFRAELTVRRFGRHLITYAATYALNIGVIRLCLAAGLSAYAAGAISVVPCAVFAYLLNRWYVFGPE